MKKSHATFRALASLVFLFVLTTVAQAQLTETWVAGNGNDVNPCTRDFPCRTFDTAILKTAVGGEINAKNAGDFGTAFITKSITIDGGGTFAGGSSGGISINDSTSATPNTAVVTLRNLSINGGGMPLGTAGVEFLSGKTLNIENCQIANFSDFGVNAYLTSSGGNLSIKNTSIFNANLAVSATTTTGSLAVSLNGCNLEQNTLAGVNLGSAGAYASIRDSVIQFNGRGVWLETSGNTVNIVGSQINNNTTGLSLSQSTTATIGSSTFMDNGTNFINSNIGSRINTFGNNQTTTSLPGVVTNLGLR